MTWLAEHDSSVGKKTGLIHLPIVLSTREPCNVHTNVQKSPSIFKPSLHNAVSAEKNVTSMASAQRVELGSHVSNQGRVVCKPVDVDPGLNVNYSIIFSCLMFFTSSVCKRKCKNVNLMSNTGSACAITRARSS